MGLSFENLYFKLYPQGLEPLRYPPAYYALIAAVAHDRNGNGVYPTGKQKAFIEFLFNKKRLSPNEHPKVWSKAIECAAKTGNAEGVSILLLLGAEKQPERSTAISLSVNEWLSQKQIKKVANREKQIDSDYFSTIKYLLEYGFCPHLLNKPNDVRAIRLAIKHQQKLPGLLDLFILHVNPNNCFCEFSVEELKILMVRFTEKKMRTCALAQDSRSYFSMLIPDMQRLIARYDFKYDNFLQLAQRTITKAEAEKTQVKFRLPIFDVPD
jgi:hypothetical protein